MSPRLILALFLGGLLAGCGTPTRKISPAKVEKLPVSEGSYGGKLLVVPWLYLGSDTRSHHFLYTYTRDNGVRQIRVLIPKTELTLDFEYSLAASQGKTLEVFPVPAPFGGIETFSTAPGLPGTHPAWNTTPLPSFDEKVRVEAPELAP